MNIKFQSHSVKILIISFILSIIFIYPLLQIDQFVGDIYKYNRDYNNLKSNYDWNEIFDDYEFGYRIFSYPFAMMNITFYQFLFITGVLFYYTTGKLMYKNSASQDKLFFYCMMLFLFPFYFAYNALLTNVIRQGLAVIVIFAFYFTDRNRGLLYYILVTFIASFFHASALIFLIVYLISRLIKSMTFYVSIFLVSTILYIFDIPITFAERLNLQIVEIFFFKKDLFLFYESNYNLGFSVLKFLATILPIFFYFLDSRQNSSQNKNWNILWQCYFLISSAGMIMSGLNYYDRILLYAWILIPILALPSIEKFLNASKNFKK
jgi:hypothetical protein